MMVVQQLMGLASWILPFAVMFQQNTRHKVAETGPFFIIIQSVTGGKDQTSGGCSLC